MTTRRTPLRTETVTIRLDRSAADALDGARANEQVSRANFTRIALLRELRRIGAWPPAPAPEGAVR